MLAHPPSPLLARPLVQPLAPPSPGPLLSPSPLLLPNTSLLTHPVPRLPAVPRPSTRLGQPSDPGQYPHPWDTYLAKPAPQRRVRVYRRVRVWVSLRIPGGTPVLLPSLGPGRLMQSQRQSSQNSSRPHSNTFSVPISFSLRHIRACSKENGSTGSSGRQQGSSVGHCDVGVEHSLEEDGSVDHCLCETDDPHRMTSWRGISENTGEAKCWSAREGVGKAIHSILSGLRNARGRWIRTDTSRLTQPYSQGHDIRS